MSWEYFEHEADIGVRGLDKTMEESFAEAAIVLVAVSIAPEKVKAREVREIKAETTDAELLLFTFLNEVVCALCRFASVRFAVRIQRAEHGLELRVTQRVDGTRMAQCVVDM